MSLEDWDQETWPQGVGETPCQQDTRLSEVKVEPCDFERLLERAMEILNARAQSLPSRRL